MLAQFRDDGLGQWPALRSHQNDGDISGERGRLFRIPWREVDVCIIGCKRPTRRLRKRGFHGAQDGRRFHDHAAAAAIGRVITYMMAIGGIIPNVVQGNGKQILHPRSFDDTFREGSGEHFREEREDIEVD